MSQSSTEYHVRRAIMEQDAAERATCAKARESHLEMAALHAGKAAAARRSTAANDSVSAEPVTA